MKYKVGDRAAERSIHITTDGTTTHAILKDGKDVIKRTKAELHPNDTFDFETGAKVAFERLWEGEVREVKRPAKDGEWIKLTEDNDDEYGRYLTGDVMQVVCDDYGMDTIIAKAVTPLGVDDLYPKYGHNCTQLLHSEYVVLENYRPPAEPELPTFTFEGFKRGDFAVNCRTEEEANIFCAYLHGKGEKWRNGDQYIYRTNWWRNKEQTCFWEGSFANTRFYEENGVSVIPFNAADLD